MVLQRYAKDRSIEATSSVRTGDLALTGERTVPGVPSENYWFRRHQAAYLHLREQVQGTRLLEVGAGEGYGTALLAERVPTVLALDYDALAIAHLARRYGGVAAVRGNLAVLPVGGATIDTLVSLQVIEHVWDHPQFVGECARVLRPGGLLMLSTPNRLTFSPGLERPLNHFHTHEFTAAELHRLVAGCGLAVSGLHGLNAGPRLAELDHRYARRGGFVAAQLAGSAEQWSAELAEDVSSIGWRDFQLSTEPATGFDELDGCLDLLLLARRP